MGDYRLVIKFPNLTKAPTNLRRKTQDSVAREKTNPDFGRPST
jgi:hypothetical protein